MSLTEFINDYRDGVFMIGHASNLVRVNGKLILFDPAWDYKPFSEYWRLLPEQINCDGILSNIDACIVSHIHDDHYDKRILNKLMCPVYVMNGRPEFEAKINSMCRDFRRLTPGNRIEITDGVCVYFMKSSFNPVDSSSFVFSDSFCFYHGNDNFADLGQIREAVKLISHVNVASIPYAYLNWYPECMEDYSPEYKHRETERLVKKLCDYAMDLSEALGADKIIPAAANLYYADELDSPFNRMGINPWEFARRARERLGDKVFTGTAGDWLMKNGKSYHGSYCRTEKRFIAEVDSALKANRPKALTADIIAEPHYITKMQAKLKGSRHKVEGHTVVFPIKGDTSLCVDLGNSGCYYSFKPVDKENTTTITIEPYQLKQWLEGKMTYEMVVATRKFKMRRNPDEYNVKVFEFILNYL